MARAIQPIPVLKGKDAERFAKQIAYNDKHAVGSLDFSKKMKIMESILAKAEWQKTIKIF